ncbi:MAG: asparagine synthase (glutamine-hydrolyzing) [Micavibrio aeruginosavorus]|uniref:asparagine synthase (glutamine-hydrolyzing) n=1 Tax=Micavibrio aeruginosavorus TaxID=349221 RepID=A0A7T5UIP9_9BACT|nr:MAG: asparagine synthase (glutamine-hydrolyzing) [Micavibrio aeruginosavorus]
MCGIAGFIDVKKTRDVDSLRAHLKVMTDSLRHRGPDGDGSWVQDHVALGHRRLAIVDLSDSGRQPMVSSSGRYVIIFNGEIYNFQDIRAELESRGVRFKGASDTEVMLESFEVWGVEESLRRFAGMFACALYDLKDRVLHLFRDRLGKKPLYFGYAGDDFAFASELKSFFALPGFAAVEEEQARHLFIRHNFIPAPWSIYKGVFKLPQAHSLCLHLDDLAATRNAADFLRRAVPYWDRQGLSSQPVAMKTEKETLEELDALLQLATCQRMIADVPLGAFLSGGIDSSLTVALMQKQSPRPVKTFSIGFSEASHNESEYARAVARHLGTDHTEFTVTPEEARSVIPHLPDIYDEPFADASQIPTWHVCRLARQQVTVALSGDGGDEGFGGYNRYLLARYVFPAFSVVPLALRQSLERWQTLTGHQNARRLLEVCGAADPSDFYRRIFSYWQDTSLVLQQGAAPDIALPDYQGSIVRHMMMADTAFYLPDDILVKVDRASMAVSLETRAPLLDHRVLEFAWTLPDHMRIKNGKGKWILRRLLARYVPDELFERPKRGFGVPLGAWLRGPLAPWMQDLLGYEPLRQQGLFRPAIVQTMVSQHLAGSHDWSYRLWGLLMYQSWHRRWMVKPDVSHKIARTG